MSQPTVSCSLLGAGGLQLLLEVQRLVVVDALVAELVIIPPKRHWGTRSQLGTFKREIPSAIFTPCPLLSPPLAPKYVRIPNVFTSALNTRLNTRIYLPTPTYFARRFTIAALGELTRAHSSVHAVAEAGAIAPYERAA